MALVLIVDDDETIVEMLADVVIETGHTAITAANGAAALTLARARPPALIISDVMMPVMDGYALLRAVRETPALRDTLIVLMSAAFAPRRSPPSDLPPDGYVAKPFHLEVIEGLLGRLPRDPPGG
jgi:CheY-like chemotaxis protein